MDVCYVREGFHWSGLDWIGLNWIVMMRRRRREGEVGMVRWMVGRGLLANVCVCPCLEEIEVMAMAGVSSWHSVHVRRKVLNMLQMYVCMMLS